jgi:hypothetical protein
VRGEQVAESTTGERMILNRLAIRGWVLVG